MFLTMLEEWVCVFSNKIQFFIEFLSNWPVGYKIAHQTQTVNSEFLSCYSVLRDTEEHEDISVT